MYKKQLRYKIDDAVTLIKVLEPAKGYHVAFSGGKDSTVVLDLVKKAGVRYEAVMTPTGLEPPALLDFVRECHPEVKIVPPERDFFQILAESGYLPTRFAPWCCQRTKAKSGKGYVVVTGVRKKESHTRAQRRMVEPDRNSRYRIMFHPIIYWTTENVWDYIRREKLEYCKLYDYGWTRIGCVACPKASANIRKFQLGFYPEFGEKIVRILDDVLDRNPRPEFSNGAEYFAWWMSGKTLEKWKEERK